jgi:hypothetical protein
MFLNSGYDGTAVTVRSTGGRVGHDFDGTKLFFLSYHLNTSEGGELDFVGEAF